MKRVLFCISILTAVIIASGCMNKETIPAMGNNENEGEEAITVNDDNAEEEQEIVLMTKEEFLIFIEENQDLETVDITVDDLVGIDIDDFIAHWHLTKDVVDTTFLKNALEWYLRDIENQTLIAYLATELVSVDSTDEEYKAFLGKFISSIDGMIIWSGGEDLVGWYRVTFEAETYAHPEGEEKTEYMWILQTKNLSDFGTRLSDSGTYLIQIPWDSSGLGYEAGFFYNKNQKFFFTGGKFEWGIQFTEME